MAAPARPGPEAEPTSPPLRVGILGDFDPARPSHPATAEALHHAARALSVRLECTWLPTQPQDAPPDKIALRRFDALWAAPGGPYPDETALLRAIQFARREGWPFVGT
jgi:CTP synthase (UTP-ammonia lyase)